LSNKADLKSS